MKKFKVGDKVRCIDDASCGLIKNEIYTIRKIENRSDTTLVYLKEIPHGHYNHRFELVEESDSLQELVDKANEGLKALQEIQKQYRGEVEYKEFSSREKDLFDCTLHIYGNYWPAELRIKTKKTFKPFTTSTGWEVRVGDGKRLHIGCRNFDSEEFERMLDFLLEHGGVYPLTHPDYISTKDGIRYSKSGETYTLPWPDAERIYKQLKEHLG